MPKLILIVIANTQDPEIAKGCEADVRSIRGVFEHLCQQTHFIFCEIVIVGTDYCRKNVMSAMDAITPFDNDVTIFYYSGHGFSYGKDRSRKFPQIDLRPDQDNKKIDFINAHTENLMVMLQLLRLRGGRVNIVIGDCCNSTIQFKRMFESSTEMNIAEDLLPPVSKAMSERLFSEGAVSIIAAAAKRGEFAISDAKIGSLFTYSFTRALAKLLSKEPGPDSLLPWHQLLEATREKAFELSKTYGIHGKPGHQEAIFEIMLEKE